MTEREDNIKEFSGGPLVTDDDIRRFSESDKKSRKIGLFVTIVFHLILIIVFLIISISRVVRQEISFISDQQLSEHLHQEELEKRESIKEAAQSQLEDQLAGRPVQRYRAVAVQRNSPLKDDRNTNADKLYKDAEDLQKRIKNAAKLDNSEGVDDAPSSELAKQNDDTPKYQGPSVLHWSLDGRSAFYLPIPVYKCKGGGDVTVQISVGRNGYVKSASIIEGSSVADGCIRNAALAAAKRSRFSVSDRASDPQVGQITYRFIEQ